MDCSPVSSRSCTPTSETDSLAWIVTVECDDGSRHEVTVLLAKAALRSPTETVADIRRSDGKSAVLAALVADPMRVPTRIVCSTEGSQPQYPN
jgi:hypothetical protein